MKHVGRSSRAVLCGFMLLLMLQGCDGGGDGPGDSANPAPANPGFTGTFQGNLTTTQRGQDVVDVVTVTMTVGSPLHGTFTTSSISNGTISGEAVGNAATFTGSYQGACAGTLTNGSAMLIDDNTLVFNTSGTDCNGPFTNTGMLTRVNPSAPTSVRMGTYTGTTSQSLPIELHVGANGVIDRLVIRIRMTLTGTGTCTTDFTATAASVAITNGRFEATVTPPPGSAEGIASTVVGTFQNNAVSGSYTGFSGNFSLLCGSLFSVGTGSLFSNGTFEATLR